MKSKPLPELKSDREAEEFVEKERLTDYDLSSLTPMRFELKRQDKSVHLRLPEALLTAVRERVK